MKAWFGKLARIALGVPFTTAMVVLLWLIGLATGSLWSGLAQYFGNTVLVAVLCGFAERHLSTVRTMSVFLLTQLLGTTATAVIVIGSGADEWWSADLLSAVEVGPSVGAVGVRCRDEGSEYLSLSGAPLARLDRDERTVLPQRLLDVVGKTLEPVYGFRSLLAYPRVAALPSVGNAIARAYLPKITFRQAFQLIGKVVTRR
ncbi:phosphatidylglycerol lysyltransferase domain-containing protein [Amycolatopsis keratiniphila]|uniref:Uncharacterized protein n=1 Tax=Amycolatopsis keratiniphila subsp. keratiniphila TaxID=227715 RepID=A0A1W2M0K2_9PSEU|nr:phosphatidylglycerol lysyltransferase domain-containing protein [Amycolatopsis keratiniphila]ONF73164.1 hypothetical protein AVR91_0207810 [Amycolatopsis keratiniphila subsp. keratiniphila]